MSKEREALEVMRERWRKASGDMNCQNYAGNNLCAHIEAYCPACMARTHANELNKVLAAYPVGVAPGFREGLEAAAVYVSQHDNLGDIAAAEIRALAPQPKEQVGERESLLIRCNDCGGTLIYKETAEGYLVFHSCKDGKQVREMLAADQQYGRYRIINGEEWDEYGRCLRHFTEKCPLCSYGALAEGQKSSTLVENTPEGKEQG